VTLRTEKIVSINGERVAAEVAEQGVSAGAAIEGVVSRFIQD
jgi:hypothetical protein